MSFGKNLQYLRRLSGNMTQEALAERLGVSRQTVSKWELDACDSAYSNLRVERVPGFRYVRCIVISSQPEDDALDRLRKLSMQYGEEKPRLIGWDFPCLSQEQINVYHLHGYAAAWILPEGITPKGMEILEQPAQRYAAIHMERPFENPFVTIPNAYRTLMDYMRLNGLTHPEQDVIPCFETAGETMDVYIACL